MRSTRRYSSLLWTSSSTTRRWGSAFPRKQSIFRIYGDLLAGFREYLLVRGFTEIHTPKIVGSATEGGANVFTFDYFGKPAFLAQSPQLYKQIMVGVFERVFEIGPAFRAEEHSTFGTSMNTTVLDVEMGFIESYQDVTKLLIELLETWCELHSSAIRPISQPSALRCRGSERFRYLTLREAQQLIFDRYGEDHRDEKDLTPQDERWIGEWASQEHETDFVMVTHFPTSKRAFYTLPDPADPEFSLSFDLIYKGQELVSGSQRINEYQELAGSKSPRAR